MRLKADYDQSHLKAFPCIHIPGDLMNGKGYETKFLSLDEGFFFEYLDGHHGVLNLH